MDSLGTTYTFQSNASKQIFPENNASNFTVQLPMEMNLTDDYAVAMKEFHYSLAFKGVREKFESVQNYIPLLDQSSSSRQRRMVFGVVDRILEKDKKIANLEQVVEECRTAVRTERNNFYDQRERAEQREQETAIFKNENDQVREKLALVERQNAFCEQSSDELTERVATCEEDKQKERELLRVQRHALSQANQALVDERRETEFWKNAYVSFTQDLFKETSSVSNTTDVPRYIYVYCDIVKKRCLGDTYAHFLHVSRVPPIRVSGDTAVDVVNTPTYIRLERQNFSQIEIALRDERGRQIEFEKDAIVIVTLHFKRIQ